MLKKRFKMTYQNLSKKGTERSPAEYASVRNPKIKAEKTQLSPLVSAKVFQAIFT